MRRRNRPLGQLARLDRLALDPCSPPPELLARLPEPARAELLDTTEALGQAEAALQTIARAHALHVHPAVAHLIADARAVAAAFLDVTASPSTWAREPRPAGEVHRG